MLYQRLLLGDLKKRYAHYIVDCLTPIGSYANILLHNFAEFLSAMETYQTFLNVFEGW